MTYTVVYYKGLTVTFFLKKSIGLFAHAYTSLHILEHFSGFLKRKKILELGFHGIYIYLKIKGKFEDF